ncbi:MAG TPA: PKD domain-containing protein [Bacteroidetes bacterium]|nr:PKD domain-containing protein [Bacteroidota bacterium]
MPLNRQETTMTSRLSTAILLGCTALLLATSAHAQVIRPSETLYLALKGGVTTYGGEIDQTGAFDDPSDDAGNRAWVTRDFGPGFGLEIGYQFTESLSFGVTGLYGRYINLDEAYPTGDNTNVECQAAEAAGTTDCQVNEGETLPSVIAALRYSPVPGWAIAPYTNIGVQATFGNDDPTDRPVGFGPYAGLGLDFRLTDQFSITAEGNMAFIFDDSAVDGVDPGGQTGSAADRGASGDDADYDNLGFYNLGLRYAFKAPYTPVEIMSLECPVEMTAGESGSFMAVTNADATPPVSVSWDWGDGNTGAGMSASHTYRTPGTYTVTATAVGDYNEDMDTCVVTVVEPQIPPTLTACRITPTRVGPGEAITFNGTVNSDASQPVSLSVDWGDGDMSDGVTFPATHSYDEVGTYTVTATASNAYGDASCEATIEVIDTFCADVSELNSVYFDFGSSALTADARERLDENLDVLRRCPDICVLIRAYTDDRESDQIRLSQARADVIRDYYVSQGIDMERLGAEGLGEDPNANSKEDPGPGDSRARRGDSIPAACGTFTPTGTSRR